MAVMTPNRLRSFALLMISVGSVCTQSALAAPMPPAYEVGSGTVEDPATMLTWQQQTSKETYTWAEATAYCSDLELGGTGWRLPTIKELHTLVDETRVNPAIDRDAFPKTASEFYWSSSRVDQFMDNAWAVSFADGLDAWFKLSTKCRVRCVR